MRAQDMKIQNKLPADWRLYRLGDLAVYWNGRAFKPEEWQEKGRPIIRIENLNSLNATFNYFQGEVRPENEVDDGDLLVSWSASLDAYMWDRGPAVLNQHIFKVEENRKIIQRRFFYHLLRHAMSTIRERVHGGTMQHITKPKFERIEVPVPPLQEQDLITRVLDNQIEAINKARAAAETRLEAAQALPTAYLREVFKNIESKKWQMKMLHEVATLLPSKSISSDGDTEVQAITTACLSESGFLPSGVKTARMWDQDADKCVAAKGEILIARSNTEDLVGRVAMFNGEPAGVVASDLTIRIWANNGIMPAFLTAYLSYLYQTGYWKKRAGGASGSMKKITRGQINRLEVPIPNKGLQRSIVESLDSRIAMTRRLCISVEKELATIKALPTALLRRAFNGEL